MKIRDYKNLNRFLTTLFNFFKENGIESSIGLLNDFDVMLERIFNSEFIDYGCNPGIEHFSIDIKPAELIEEPEVYMFLFGGSECSNNSMFMIELGERDYKSFISFSWHENKIPPFLCDFMDKPGYLMTSNFDGDYEEYFKADEIMNFEEFEIYLNKNVNQGCLKIIEVD